MKLIIKDTDVLNTLDDYYTKIVYKPTSYILALDEILVTNIYAVLELYAIKRFDIIEMRNYVRTNILPLWDFLTSDEKIELEKQFIYPLNHIMVLTEEQQLHYWDILVKIKKVTRDARIMDCKTMVSYYLIVSDVLLIFEDTKELFRDYIDAEKMNLIYWINSTANFVFNIDYTTTGLASKSYYTINLQNKLIAILEK